VPNKSYFRETFSAVYR